MEILGAIGAVVGVLGTVGGLVAKLKKSKLQKEVGEAVRAVQFARQVYRDKAADGLQLRDWEAIGPACVRALDEVEDVITEGTRTFVTK